LIKVKQDSLIKVKCYESGDADSGEEGVSASVITHGDTPPVFEFSEHIFNLVPFFIKLFIVCYGCFSIFPWRDARRNPFFHQGCPEPVRVIAAIGQHRFGFRQDRQQQDCALVITRLSFGQSHGDGTAALIAHSMKF